MSSVDSDCNTVSRRHASVPESAGVSFYLSQEFLSQPSASASAGCSVTQVWQTLQSTAMFSSSRIEPPRARVFISCKSVPKATQQRSHIGILSSILTRNLRLKSIFLELVTRSPLLLQVKQSSRKGKKSYSSYRLLSYRR